LGSPGGLRYFQFFAALLGSWPVAVVLTLPATTLHAGAQQPAAADRTIWDGVYTSDQAARGRPRYQTSCSRCHNNELVGSERGPALKGNAFLSKYENDDLGRLFTLIRDTMPADGAAGVVSDEVKLDILAYILSRNEVPPGSRELEVNAAALETIRITKLGVEDGVYTTAQAERGKASFLTGRCGGCHQLDLSGDRGPALKGEEFLAHWEHGSVNALFTKISETMPPNAPYEATDEAKIDIVAYLLQSNGFPAGGRELKLDRAVLDAIEIVRRGRVTAAPNFALVQVVGCLGQSSTKAWVLTRATEPVITKQEASSAAGLKDAEARALGTQTLRLISVTSFKPESHHGHKMEARGLLYRDERDALLNLTSLQTVGRTCN
jgi:mono/diheme cytochrome c family protein